MNTAAQAKPKKRTLGEIIEDFRRVLHGIDEAEGEITPELEVELNQVEGDFASKVDRCLWVAKEAEAQAGVFAERAKTLADRARVLKAQGKRLEDYVHAAMLTLKVDKVHTPNFVARVQVSNPSLGVLPDKEEELLKTLADDFDTELWDTYTDPPRGLRVKLELDKKALLDDLKLGRGVGTEWGEYVWLVQDKTHLRVK
jgi:hypothetical protein